MTSTQLLTPAEINSSIFSEIKKCMNQDNSFCMKRDGTTVRVAHVPNSGSMHDLTVTKVTEAFVNAIDISVSVQEVVLERRLVYYTRFDDEEGDFIASEGTISSIEEKDGETTFTIIDPKASQYLGSPVFIQDEVKKHDKVEKVARFIGVIIPENKAIHIDFFKNIQNTDSNLGDDDLGDERGSKKRVTVASGEYKGVEQGTGKGPRSITINGPKIGQGGLSYKLTFISGKNKTNPHDDGNYNKNQVELYQQALDTFVALQTQSIPPSFKFDFSGTEYTAEEA